MESKEAPRKAVKGDRIHLNTSGGGGWGDPRKRQAQKVYEDVLDGIISKEIAENVYGVIIEPSGINLEKTEKRRKY
jgi:N-methylhydantoinase B